MAQNSEDGEANKCIAVTKSGKKCRRNALPNEHYCKTHLYLKYQPKKIRLYRRPSFIVATVLALIGISLSIYLYSGVVPLKPVAFSSLSIHSILFENIYKNDNGNYEGEIKYVVSNNSKTMVHELPQGAMSWYGQDIGPPVLKFYGDKAVYNDSSTLSIRKYETQSEVYLGQTLTSYGWIPELKPGIAPGETLEYGILVSARGTQKNIFTEEGSYASMGTWHYKADKISLVAQLPFGYVLSLRSWSVRGARGETIPIDLKAVPKPELFSDSTGLIWKVINPFPDALYEVNIAAKRRW